MSKSSLLDPALAERIAHVYCEKYKHIGYAAASDYIEQALKQNALHIAQVREIVVQILNPLQGR